jgi:pimeloyl-ACP methyl ester carboxylesterase
VTYLLIHGGGSSARFWDRLLPYLHTPALAVDLPGRNGKAADFCTLSVDDEVASVIADVEAAQIADRIVVVAHSSGGLVVPGVVAGLRGRVTRVVLNAALVPSPGACGVDCLKPNQRAGLTASVEQSRQDGTAITLHGPPADPEQFRNAYGGDPLDDETLAYMVDPPRCVPDTVNHYFQPVDWTPVAGVPITYLLNTRDRPVPSATQQEMAARLPVPKMIIRLDSGHVPAVTDPERFAFLLASAGG